MADNLKDYGARYVQIDDGWQGETKEGRHGSRDWTTVDKAFPGGMAALAARIRALGFVPGIWIAPHGQSNEDVVKSMPGVFLFKPDGTSASESWEGTLPRRSLGSRDARLSQGPLRQARRLGLRLLQDRRPADRRRRVRQDRLPHEESGRHGRPLPQDARHHPRRHRTEPLPPRLLGHAARGRRDHERLADRRRRRPRLERRLHGRPAGDHALVLHPQHRLVRRSRHDAPAPAAHPRPGPRLGHAPGTDRPGADVERPADGPLPGPGRDHAPRLSRGRHPAARPLPRPAQQADLGPQGQPSRPELRRRRRVQLRRNQGRAGRSQVAGPRDPRRRARPGLRFLERRIRRRLGGRDGRRPRPDELPRAHARPDDRPHPAHLDEPPHHPGLGGSRELRARGGRIVLQRPEPGHQERSLRAPLRFPAREELRRQDGVRPRSQRRARGRRSPTTRAGRRSGSSRRRRPRSIGRSRFEPAPSYVFPTASPTGLRVERVGPRRRRFQVGRPVLSQRRLPGPARRQDPGLRRIDLFPLPRPRSRPRIHGRGPLGLGGRLGRRAAQAGGAQILDPAAPPGPPPADEPRAVAARPAAEGRMGFGGPRPIIGPRRAPRNRNRRQRRIGDGLRDQRPLPFVHGFGRRRRLGARRGQARVHRPRRRQGAVEERAAGEIRSQESRRREVRGRPAPGIEGRRRRRRERRPPRRAGQPQGPGLGRGRSVQGDWLLPFLADKIKAAAK